MFQALKKNNKFFKNRLMKEFKAFAFRHSVTEVHMHMQVGVSGGL